MEQEAAARFPAPAVAASALSDPGIRSDLDEPIVCGSQVSADRIVEEFENGDYIVVLDGQVLEVFYGPRATSDRRHVKHVNIDVTEGRHGETMTIGSKVPTDERRSRINVVPEDKDRINAMISEAIARGASGTAPP